MEPIRTAFPKLFTLGVSCEALAVVGGATICAVIYAFVTHKPKKWIWIGLTAEYVCYIVYVTLMSRPFGEESLLDWDLIGKHRQAWEQMNPEAMYDIVMNVVLFVPLGLLMVSSFKQFQVSSGLKVVAVAFMLSLFIELMQYLFCLGTCELADVLHNTLGACLGVFILKLCRLIWIRN